VAVPRRGPGGVQALQIAVLLTHSDQLLLRKITKLHATRFLILRLKCTKVDFRWGSSADLARGAYSAPRPSSGV